MASKTALVVFLALVGLQVISSRAYDYQPPSNLLDPLKTAISDSGKSIDQAKQVLDNVIASVVLFTRTTRVTVGKEFFNDFNSLQKNATIVQIECGKKANEPVIPLEQKFFNGQSQCQTNLVKKLKPYDDAMTNSIVEAKSNMQSFQQSYHYCQGDFDCHANVIVQIVGAANKLKTKINQLLTQRGTGTSTTMAAFYYCEYKNLQALLEALKTVAETAVKCFEDKAHATSQQ